MQILSEFRNKVSSNARLKAGWRMLSNILRRTRLVTGLILFTYVTTHFINHMLGMVSLKVMEAGLDLNLKIWDTGPGRYLLYGSLLIHFCMALWSLYRRRSLRMPLAELLQMVMGFSVPFLAAQHVFDTRVAMTSYDANIGYSWQVYSFWVQNPQSGAVQILLLFVVWIHACIGLNFNVKIKPWFPRWKQFLFALAVLIPTLATAGFFSAGHAVEALARDPAWIENLRQYVPQAAQQAALYKMRDTTWASILFLIVAALLARWVRWFILSRRGIVTVTYDGGRRVPVLTGSTVLEASRSAGIPHASICGGKGRCSTCRVMVISSVDALNDPDVHEMMVLHRVGAGPNVRLACQLRPTCDLSVTPMLAATATAKDGYARPTQLQGVEREMAILFADIRGFTQLSEKKLPYDVVFLLNRYFMEMGTAVESAGGVVDKYIGDGVMALFGLDCDPKTACRQALVAARGMSERLVALNLALKTEVAEPIRIGIGVHSGLVIVGEMGYGKTLSVTAIGDAVNTASRLEALCKPHACELIVSQDLAARAEVDFSAYPHLELEIRGRVTPMAVHAVKAARELRALPPARGRSRKATDAQPA
ncbi:adenylate/guanylate cyclase domain-containing protein [soil metagenome]